MNHSYHDALFRWLASHGHAVAISRYPRVVASGETTVYRISPRLPKARLLIVHGTGNDALYPFANIIQKSVERGIEVVAFDLDGHGVNSTTLLDARVAPSAIAAANSFVRTLTPTLDTHILGHSLGGALTVQAIATGLVDEPASLILLATPVRLSPVPKMVIKEALSMVHPRFWRSSDPASLWSRIPAFGAFKREFFPVRLAGGDGSMFAYIDLVSHMFELAAIQTRIKGIRCPVLLIYGENDDIAPVEHATLLKDALKSGSAETMVLARASHLTLPFFTEVAESVARHIGS